MKESSPPEQPSQAAEPSEYERFKAGLRQILNVPKKEIDRREVEWQQQREQQKKAKSTG